MNTDKSQIDNLMSKFYQIAGMASSVVTIDRGWPVDRKAGKSLEDIICDIAEEGIDDFANDLATLAGKFYVREIVPVRWPRNCVEMELSDARRK